MDIEDLEPRRKAPQRKDLTVLSMEALRDYIGELEAEIARARAAIADKEKARKGADSFFKK